VRPDGLGDRPAPGGERDDRRHGGGEAGRERRRRRSRQHRRGRDAEQRERRNRDRAREMADDAVQRRVHGGRGQDAERQAGHATSQPEGGASGQHRRPELARGGADRGQQAEVAHLPADPRRERGRGHERGDHQGQPGDDRDEVEHAVARRLDDVPKARSRVMIASPSTPASTPRSATPGGSAISQTCRAAGPRAPRPVTARTAWTSAG
jgi:hypothetical protein